MDVDEKTREMNAVDERCRVLEDENLALKQELDEANAVIGKVRGVRRYVNARKVEHYERWNDTDSTHDCACYASYGDVVDRLDGIDGL